MNDKQSIQGIMVLLKKKYNAVEQILNYTNDIRESLSQDDFDTVNMLLDLRANLMNEADNYDSTIHNFIDSLSEENRLRVICQISDSEISSAVSFEESKIREIYLMTKSLIAKIIELDNIIGIQIAARNKLLAMENA